MGAGKRFILAVLGILALLCSVFLILATLGVLDGTALFSVFKLYRITGNLQYTVLGFVILLIGVILLAFSMQSAERKEGGTIVSFTEIGEVRISFKAIENMVLAASRKVKGIREVSTRISYTEQGLVIYLRIKVLPDIVIPELTSKLQAAVKDYVEEICGSGVAEIKILIEDIAQEIIKKNVR